MTTTITFTNAMEWKSTRPFMTTTVEQFVERIEREDPTFETLVSPERCLYFDVDNKIGNEKLDEKVALVIEEKALEYAIECINGLSDSYNLNIPNNIRYSIATSHGEALDNHKNPTNKYSVRLWFPEIKGHAEQIKTFIQQTNKWINSKIGTDNHISQYIDYGDEFFDSGIYDTNRKMRCIGTSKPNEDRPLILKVGTIKDTIISNIEEAKYVIPTLDLDNDKNVGSAVSKTSTSNIEKYKDYMTLIPSSKFANYESWFKINCASSNIGIPFEVYDRFMKDCSGYDRDNNLKCYGLPNTSKKGSLGWRYIYSLAFECNPLAKQELDKKYSNSNMDFQHMKEQFEEQHLKIINKGFFIKETENDFIIMKKTHLETAYEHMITLMKRKDKKGEEETVPSRFIKVWLGSINMRIKEDIDIIPHDQVCPDNIFNLWKPFDAEKIHLKTYNKEAVDIFKNHIFVLCGNDHNVASYFEKWIGQMLKFPSVKTICPVLISKEGAGKGTFVKLMTALIGSKRVFESTTPERDVWGTFNSNMKESYFVVLNELSKKQTLEAEGKIKGLITDPTVDINEKNIGTYKVKSYHRFMITTNNEDPIKTTDDDRRKLIIRSSDELIGNKPYFNKLNDLLKDPDVIRSCYDYFVGLDGLDTFNNFPIPRTEYQDDLKELSRSPIDMWIESFVSKQPVGVQEIESSKLYQDWANWKSQNGIVFECNIKSFSLKMKNLKIQGIDKHKDHHNRRWVFNINNCREHFKMGPLINIEGETDSDDGFTDEM